MKSISIISRATVLNDPEIVIMHDNIAELINSCYTDTNNKNLNEETLNNENMALLEDALELGRDKNSKMKLAARKLKNDKTLLMQAIIKKMPNNIIKELLKYESGKMDSKGKNAFMYAAEKNRAELIKFFVKKDCCDPLSEAFILSAKLDNLRFLQELMINDELEITEVIKQQALIHATREKSYRVVNYLVRNISLNSNIEDPEKILSAMLTIFNEKILQYTVENEKIFKLLNTAIKFEKDINIFDTLLKELNVKLLNNDEILELYVINKYYVSKVTNLEVIDDEVFNILLWTVENYLKVNNNFDSKFSNIIVKSKQPYLFGKAVKFISDEWGSLKNILGLIDDQGSEILRILIDNINTSSIPNEINDLIFNKLKFHFGKIEIHNDLKSVNNLCQIIENFIKQNGDMKLIEEQTEFYNKVFKFSVDYKKVNLLGVITEKHTSMLSSTLCCLINEKNIELANPIIENVNLSLIDENSFMYILKMIEKYLKAVDINKLSKKTTDKLYNIVEKYEKFIEQDKLTKKSVNKLFYLSTFISDKIKRAELILANENRNEILDSLILNNVHTHLNEKGQNALMEAAEKGLRNLVTKLLPKTSNKLLKDKSGCNVFDLAIINGRYEVVDTLISSKEMEKYFIFQKDFWFKNRWKTSIINRLLGTGTIVENLEMRNLMYKLKMNSDIDNDSKNGILNLVNTSFGVNIDQNFFDNDQSRVNDPHDQSKKVAEETANFYKENLSRITTNDLVTTASEDSIITPRYSSPMASNSQLKVDSVIQRTSKLTLA